MSETVGVVVAHGDLADSLVGVAEEISGVRGALQPISNQGYTPEELQRQIEMAVGGQRAVVFVDLISGSCGFAGRSVCTRLPDGEVVVIAGVNIPLLLDFLFHRDMPLLQLATRLVEKGRQGTVAFAPDACGDGS